MKVRYAIEPNLHVTRFVDVLRRSTPAAPAAREYYPHVGLERHDSCWMIRGK